MILATAFFPCLIRITNYRQRRKETFFLGRLWPSRRCNEDINAALELWDFYLYFENTADQ